MQCLTRLFVLRLCSLTVKVPAVLSIFGNVHTSNETAGNTASSSTTNNNNNYYGGGNNSSSRTSYFEFDTGFEVETAAPLTAR
jgi:hypothetical protein